jgi:hypothetical protein
VRRRRQPASDAEHALQTDLARFAAGVDLELRLACRNEQTMRRELGCAARAFLRHHLYRRLAFVRLSDYARERLGVSARTVQAAAWLAERLDTLPAVSRAYDRSEITWAQARAICRVASGDESQWLAAASRCTVEELERLVRRSPASRNLSPDPEPEPGEIDGEPAVRWRLVCPARVRALWRRAIELASRAAGEPLAAWRAAELIAAEGFSGRPSGIAVGDRALLACLRLARRAARRVAVANALPSPVSMNEAGLGRVRAATADCAPVAASPSAAAHTHADDSMAALTAADPFALDARLIEAMRVIRTCEPRIGRLLRVVVDRRLYRLLGFASFDGYLRERLGISSRKAWALLKVEKATSRSEDFARTYRDGRLSWARALALLPVLDRATAPAWIERAEAVTVRRLYDEVSLVLEARDAVGARASLSPPPLGAQLLRDLSLPVRVQIGARSEVGSAVSAEVGGRAAYEVCDAEISFIGPASVIALMRDIVDAFERPGTPRWTAFERMLQQVIGYWEATPRHPDPIFARDGWRCTVPACSSRRNLHDHHIRFRSRGGDNARDNRTVVCAAHHLHGIHAGVVRAAGTAPDAIEWDLGVRPGAPPLLRFIGDCVRGSG